MTHRCHVESVLRRHHISRALDPRNKNIISRCLPFPIFYTHIISLSSVATSAFPLKKDLKLLCEFDCLLLCI